MSGRARAGGSVSSTDAGQRGPRAHARAAARRDPHSRSRRGAGLPGGQDPRRSRRRRRQARTAGRRHVRASRPVSRRRQRPRAEPALAGPQHQQARHHAGARDAARTRSCFEASPRARTSCSRRPRPERSRPSGSAGRRFTPTVRAWSGARSRPSAARDPTPASARTIWCWSRWAETPRSRATPTARRCAARFRPRITPRGPRPRRESRWRSTRASAAGAGSSSTSRCRSVSSRRSSPRRVSIR